MSYIKSYCNITPEGATLNGEVIFQLSKTPSPTKEEFVMNDLFSALYEHLGIDYRKFFKMDALSKLGFLASELLLEGADREVPKPDMGIILFNSSSSLEADRNFQQTIRNQDDFYPSPSEFVYTLPNIVTGEIAIRNKIFGETAFYVMRHLESEYISQIIDDTLYCAGLKYVLAGWVEVDVPNNSLNCLMILCTAERGKPSVNESDSYLPTGYLKNIHTGNNEELDLYRITDFYMSDLYNN